MANHRRSVEKEAYWRGHFERQSASGLLIRRWCRENGVSEPTFYVWRRKLQERDHKRGLTDRDRHAPLSEAAFAPDVVAVDVVTSNVLTSDVLTSYAESGDREAKLENDVAGGLVIRLREDASTEILERVLTVVCRHGIASAGCVPSLYGRGQSWRGGFVLSIPSTPRVFLATAPTDMRKGFDGLFTLVENVIREDPFSGHLFVFRNRKRDRLKVLWWDTDGLAIFYKRLERGNYQFPTDSEVSKSGTTKSRCEIRSDELSLPLAGIDLGSVKRRRRYQRPSADGKLTSDRKPVSPA